MTNLPENEKNIFRLYEIYFIFIQSRARVENYLFNLKQINQFLKIWQLAIHKLMNFWCAET